MKKTFTLITLAFCLNNITKAQTATATKVQTAPKAAVMTMPFGKIDIADLELKNCDFEKDANAMVLFDKADVYFDTQFNIVMERHKRIKIFNDKGKDEANVRLEFYGGTRAETMSDVQVETINEVNGKPEITKLEKKLIFTETVDKWRNAIVFAFPNVKPGSVIEFKYKWQTVTYGLPSWYFQSNIPTRYSELSTSVPDLLYYKTQTRTIRPYFKNVSSEESASFGGGIDAVNYTKQNQLRAMANIPSLQDEPFMHSRIDNLQCIYFQLTSIRPVGSFVRNFNDSWGKIEDQLATDEDFGDQLKRKLKDEDAIITKAKQLKTTDDKIAYIFNEVKNKMKWNDFDAWYTIDGTSKAWEKQTGNSTEINIALYHLLKQAGVDAYPMVVSTREHGRANPAYPSLYQFNRTVTYVQVDSTKNYILDASGKYNTYNEIPDGLLNSHGLAINKDQKSYQLVYIEKQQSVRQIVFINADITADGKLNGEATINSFSYQKLSKVEKYKKDGDDKYKKYLSNDDNNMMISSLKLENMDVDSLPLTQKVGFKLALAGSDENYIYVNPNLFTSMRSNPFLSENRATDVDFGYRNNYVIYGNYKIPAGFKTDALPKNLNLQMPDQSITFRRIVGEEDGVIKVNYTINYNKTIFYKENYPELREFYKKMQDMLNEQIVFKKT